MTVKRWASGLVMGAAMASANAQQGEVAGMSSERLARIAPAMREQVDKGIFPGAVTLVARRGEVVHYEAHGYLDAAKTRPMTKNAIFQIGRAHV